MGVDINDDMKTREFLELQEANNIAKAAFKEVLATALKAKTWVVGTPALGSIEEFQLMFQSTPPPGMRVERSVATALLPITPSDLASLMMDVDLWASFLSRIVCHGSSHAPTGVLQHLPSADKENIISVKMVNAEFQLPTPFVQTRKFCFLRFLRRIVQDIWAIVDVSHEYFQHTSSIHTLEPPMCRRRPSAVIIRRVSNSSEVIWIENVEVHECQAPTNIYSTIVNSEQAFGAKRWVSTLLWSLKRENSRFINVTLRLDQRARGILMRLADCMKSIYLECVHEAPDERRWAILSDQGGLRILKDKTANCGETLDPHIYTAVIGFRVPAKPLSVFHFLAKKNLELQWPSSLYPSEPEELIKFTSEDDSNCITVHKKEAPRNCKEYHHGFLLQESSRDDFCSFVISLPMTQSVLDVAFSSARWRYESLKPSGFSIMPGGSGGLNSSTSLVTFVMQKELGIMENDEAIEVMSKHILAMVQEISRAGNIHQIER